MAAVVAATAVVVAAIVVVVEVATAAVVGGGGALIAEVALPLLFDAIPDLELAGDVPFAGWAFRGPLSVPICWRP